MNASSLWAKIVILAILCLNITAPAANAASELQAAETHSSSAEILRSARVIYIQSNSVFFKPSTLENALLQREEFQEWGMEITRNQADADLIIEVDRKLFTTSFVYSVILPRAHRVLASGRVNSIGGTVEGKISDSFIKRLRKVRAASAGSK
jgi:hypothetical protein